MFLLCLHCFSIYCFSMIFPHQYPRLIARSAIVRCFADGQELDVLQCPGGDFCSFEMDGPVTLRLELGRDLPVTVRPERRKLDYTVEGRQVRIHLPEPGQVCLELGPHPGQMTLLFLLAKAPVTDRPAPDGKGVHYFRAGQIYEVGHLTLRSGEICYLEGGAVVRGCLWAHDAENVRISGPGVLDNGYFARHGENRHPLLLDTCTGCLIKDLTIINPTAWMTVLGGCRDIAVRSVNLLGTGGGSDGIDICGCRGVTIEDCLLRNGDDNLVIKAIDKMKPAPWVASHYRAPAQEIHYGDWRKDTSEVVARRCLLWNDEGGSAMEIGYETLTEEIRDVRFEDIDVLGVHNFGSVFGIHNGDRCHVHDITWRDIRVEHHYDKLIDFRVLFSRWNQDRERGRVSRVRLENIRVVESAMNPGYTVSIMAGYDVDHPIEDVVLKDFFLNERRVTRPEDLPLLSLHARNIRME